MAVKYSHTIIEKKWQDKWESEKLYVADIAFTKKPTFFNLWMFPYPSAEGLHAGHAFASTGSDVYGRFMRMNGHEVFQPIGYDSFGIHSENYAIKIGQDPHEVVKRTTKHYEEQMRSLGHGYDWTRTVTTSSPDYYKWTQWLFLKMFEAGLAYKKKASVNFCPSCKTVLADEQVMSPKAAGKEPKNAQGEVIQNASEDLKVCERCGTVAEKRDLDQWFFKITDYADRLLDGIEKIDWSKRVLLAQKEWIGKKSGVIIHHKIKNSDKSLDTFSAYPAWLFADTFLVMAPEHPIVSDLVRGTKYEKDVLNFVENFKKSSKDKQGSKLNEKEGVFTGTYVIDPFSGREMPVWLANFALMDFGTGIIRCSAHDERDYEFALKYKIPLREVVERVDPKLPINAHGNSGILKDSGPFTGKSISIELIEEMLDWMVKEKIGERNTNYHLRDWLVSRQRYWGAPIPMIYCESCAKKGDGYLNTMGNVQGESLHMLHKNHSDWKSEGWWPDDNLPVLLPSITDFKPEGEGKGPLANHKEFYGVDCPKCGEAAKRETDVMDTFVDSSWYFLRYPSVGIDNVPFDADITKHWLPVDLYFGGAEHSVLHLMYARFVTKVLYDLKLLAFDEPFPKFFAHGLMIKDGAKMSKSRGNVVNPDEYVKKFGADVMRMYEMFLGPMDGNPDFRDSGIEGMQRFLGRVWRLFNESINLQMDKYTNNDEVQSRLHQTIKGVTEDIKLFKYNTAIAKIMELVNLFTEYRVSNLEYLSILSRLLAPFAPHMMEEVWVEYLHQPFSIHKAEWPVYDPKMIMQSEANITIQINGKVRGQFTVDSQQSMVQEKIEKMAKEDENVAKYLEGQVIKKAIFIPGKLINFVI